MYTDADRALLSRPLHAFVANVAPSNSLPAPRPVWFELGADDRIELFSFASAARVTHLRDDPRLAVVVTAPVGEPEYWVAIDGDVTLHEDGAFELAERLALRYWGDDLGGKTSVVNEWRDAELVRISVQPTAVRRSEG